PPPARPAGRARCLLHVRSPDIYRLEAPSFRAGRKAETVGHVCLLVLSVAVGSLIGVSRYRLQPSPAQEQALLEHCRHARFVWNLAVEQHAHWKPGRKSAPGFAEQCRQLTEARAAFAWLRAGSIIVQQQALKDFAQAISNFFGGTHRRPTWRKRGQSEGFRIVAVKAGDVHRVSRHVGEMKVPKVGWIRFRWSRALPEGVKSYRITCDRAGRWHVAFAVIPDPIPAPGLGEVVGVDRGVAVSAALSTGEQLNAPGLCDAEKARLLRLLRKLARAERGSNRRGRVKAAIARLKARESDRRKDWVEKVSTDLARRFDVIGVEDLKIRAITRSARGTVDRRARESQARYRCRSCGYAGNADVNAARNIAHAAGHAVSAREGPRVAGPVHREPQRDLLLVG